MTNTRRVTTTTKRRKNRAASHAFVCAVALIFFWSVVVGHAATITVGPSGDHATIQAALDAAVHGDEIVVSAGIYNETIRFNGKNVVLRSTDPTNPAVVAATVIDAGLTTTAVTLDGTEGTTCVLSGFTIRNGRDVNGAGIDGNGASVTIQYNVITSNTVEANVSGTGYGGGLLDCDGPIQFNTIHGNKIVADHYGHGAGLSGCDGTIQDNTITNNTVTITGNNYGGHGGGLYQCNGSILRNTITGNSAPDGGGLYDCDGTIRDNTIRNNVAIDDDNSVGGGLALCGATIQNNIISENQAIATGASANDNSSGGGLYGCDGTILSNTIANNSAEYGGGLSECDGTVVNNTVVYNAATDGAGGGLDKCHGFNVNLILWENTATEPPWVGGPGGENFSDSAIPIYSCMNDWTAGGVGNTASTPTLTGDYHLQPGSVGIDAGNANYLLGDFIVDIDGEARVAGASVDMGSDETASSPDADGDLLADANEAAAGGQPDQPDTDGDGLLDGVEVRRGTQPNVPDTPTGLNVPSGVASAQEGIFLALGGETVTLAAATTYTENLHFLGKNVVLQGSDPLDPSVVASTVVDANRTGCVVFFLGTEDATSAIRGLTLQNGEAPNVGGIYGHGTLALIEYNRVLNNEGGWGGGIGYCDGVIQHNVISDNYASYTGGGLANCNGRIQFNDILNNEAYHGVAALMRCDGLIHGNRIAGNESIGGAAAIEECDGTIRSNTIVGNSTLAGEMVFEDCEAMIANNTIADNSCNVAGGSSVLWDCDGLILNNIIWDNSGYAFAGSNNPIFCCVDETLSSGIGNIREDPKFIDQANGDYRLAADSPCINTGYTWYLEAEFQSDIDTECRLIGGVVDMGSDEYGSSPDADRDLLADSEEATHGSSSSNPDSDGDGLLDGVEVVRGTPPGTYNAPTTITVPTDYPLIQQSIFLAFPGEVIDVAAGSYLERLRSFGRNFVLQGNGRPQIDGVGFHGRLVTFKGSEDASCVVRGFTIQHGNERNGGGILGQGTLATIEGNWITNNHATRDGGGIYDCDGLIQNNMIIGNHGPDGAGLFGCDGVIRNNTLYGNDPSSNGGAIEECNATVLTNCIVWGTLANDEILNSTAPTYCCIEDWSGGGTGNISTDPNFRSPGFGDFRLHIESPCIEAGGAVSLTTDAYGNTRPYDCNGLTRGDGSEIDIGADEFAERDLAPWISEYLVGTYSPTPTVAPVLDANGDGVVDVADIVTLLQ